MKNLNVYLVFPGNCEEALHFYVDCFGGEISSLHRMGDNPGDTPADYRQKIMHAEFKAEGIYFMACDKMPDQPVQNGNAVQLSVNLDNAEEQAAIFNKLSAGGTVLMPLQETFWGAVFGMLIDKYGFQWMLNREMAK